MQTIMIFAKTLGTFSFLGIALMFFTNFVTSDLLGERNMTLVVLAVLIASAIGVWFL